MCRARRPRRALSGRPGPPLCVRPAGRDPGAVTAGPREHPQFSAPRYASAPSRALYVRRPLRAPDATSTHLRAAGLGDPGHAGREATSEEAEERLLL